MKMLNTARTHYMDPFIFSLQRSYHYNEDSLLLMILLESPLSNFTSLSSPSWNHVRIGQYQNNNNNNNPK